MEELRVFVAAFGGGMGMAIFWFPITYFAMRKQYQLRETLFGASRQFFSCTVLLALAKLLGLGYSTSKALSLATFWIVPVCVCAAVLYTTYRTAQAELPEQKTSAGELNGISAEAGKEPAFPKAMIRTDRISQTPLGRSIIAATVAWALCWITFLAISIGHLYLAHQAAGAEAYWREHYESQHSTYCVGKPNYQCRETNLALEFIIIEIADKR